ncbi:protein tyrosine phosphatase [Lujinxingia litoralis]|uniref:Protein tyrosine phosphatase n=1 Tax=Lujinxingia litoralis TaxID=2211119 RepID=A0A328C8F9_9DELT|nr:protein tyrosine phosphatase [Lujinxingia litoralis]RAL23626.1 protein tyrosine phosphatase [Lujinxingia litoralis]
MPTRRIICICTGNICRSPMAAALLRAKLGQQAVVISAGTLGLQGRPAAPFAQLAVEPFGASLDDHRSQGISVPLMRMADHVIVMSPRHSRHVLGLAPELQARLVELWNFDPERQTDGGIPDPVGQSREAFEHCCALIDRCLTTWLDTLPPI